MIVAALVVSLLLTPDCNLRRSEFDNPISDNGGLYQPRIVWDLEYAIGSVVLAVAVDKLTRHYLPRWLTATSVWLGVGVLPHVRSVFVQHRYTANWPDIAFDAVNRGTAVLWGLSGDSTRSRWKPFAGWLALDGSLVCASVP